MVNTGMSEHLSHKLRLVSSPRSHAEGELTWIESLPLPPTSSVIGIMFVNHCGFHFLCYYHKTKLSNTVVSAGTWCSEL